MLLFARARTPALALLLVLTCLLVLGSLRLLTGGRFMLTVPDPGLTSLCMASRAKVPFLLEGLEQKSPFALFKK